jgi:hypothetical protein
MKANLTLSLAALLLASATTVASAHSASWYRHHHGRVFHNSESRDTAYGQGGTAGTHPTGANVGPGRAEMNHAD